MVETWEQQRARAVREALKEIAQVDEELFFNANAESDVNDDHMMTTRQEDTATPRGRTSSSPHRQRRRSSLTPAQSQALLQNLQATDQRAIATSTLDQ